MIMYLEAVQKKTLKTWALTHDQSFGRGVGCIGVLRLELRTFPIKSGRADRIKCNEKSSQLTVDPDKVGTSLCSAADC